MPRSRRYIESRQVYEICFRVRSGLPFTALSVVDLLLKSAIARTQRDHKVDLCHFLWMANHPHLLIRALDAEQCKRFYGEIQKRVTDSFKRLMGRKRLLLWEKKPVVAKILDLDETIERIGYFYLNPARAHLVESIADYPGLSSWRAFRSAEPSVNVLNSEVVPWIRMPQIKRLPARSLSNWEDQRISKKLTMTASVHHTLEIRPNAWMKAFKICAPEEIASINNRIIHNIASVEQALTAERARTGRTVLGSKRLRNQSIFQPHRPKKHGRRIFVLSSSPELRSRYIQSLRLLTQQCVTLFTLACKGVQVTWPPGISVPPIPPLANTFA